MLRALVVGSVSEGLHLSVPSDSAHGRTVVIPRAEKIMTPVLYRGFGGGALNISVALARLGISTTCLGAVGTDLVGRVAEQYLRSQRVQPRFARIASLATGQSIVLRQNRQIQILMARGANDALTPAFIRRHLSKYFDVLVFAHLSGAADQFLRQAKLPAAARLFWCPGLTQLEQRPQRYRAALRARPIVLLNQSELSAWTGITNRARAAAHLIRLGARGVVITRGAWGAQVFGLRPGVLSGRARSVKIADLTGAGDAFAAGFIAYYAQTADPKIALRAGLVNAAANVQVLGDHEGVLTRAKLSSIIHLRKGL